jgi:hypothetical protein
MESTDQGTVRVANTCGGFGWEHEPFLDLGEDEEESTVMAANATGPQLLDAYGARQRMPQQRVPIPVNRPVLPVTAIPRTTPVEGTGSAGSPTAQGNAPPHSATAPAAPAQPLRSREPGIADLTDDAGGRASSAPPSANVPTMTGTFSMEWTPTKEWFKHGSPSLIRDMASTMRKVGQTLCKQSAPRHLVHSPAVPTVRKVAGKPDVERAYVDPMSRAPIAHISVRIGGVNGYQTPGAIDSGADVNVMAMSAMKAAKLESRFQSGSPRFTQADGNESMASGWLDTVIGLGNNFELGARCVIKEGIDYDVLFGTTSMRSINGVISFVRNRFEFQLPLTKQWRALPLIEPKRRGAPTRVSVVGSTSTTLEGTSARGAYAAEVKDVFGAGTLDTAFPSGEAEEGGNLDAEMGVPDLLGPEEDIEYDNEDLENAEDLPHVARCREPPDNPIIPKDIEPPKSSPANSAEAQPAQEKCAEKEDDYAFGVIFSSLHDVRRHFTNLVVKGLISLTEAREQTARYNDLFRTTRQEEFLHPICSSHLRYLHALARLEVLTNEAQGTLNPLEQAETTLEGRVNHAADVRKIDALPLPRLPDKEQWEAVAPKIKMGPNLTTERRRLLLEVLFCHPHAFSKDPEDLSLVRGVYHCLDTGDGGPIKRASRPLSPFEREKIDRQMAPMEKWNVIWPSTSPFAAPVVLARKKGGKWRFCVDYRALNKLTVPSRYPPPRIDGILDKLGPARFFTTLDAQSGYWQNTHAPGRRAQDGLSHAQGVVRVPPHAVWAHHGAGHIPNGDGRPVEGRAARHDAHCHAVLGRHPPLYGHFRGAACGLGGGPYEGSKHRPEAVLHQVPFWRERDGALGAPHRAQPAAPGTGESACTGWSPSTLPRCAASSALPCRMTSPP